MTGWTAARARVLPRIGPTHGVQATAKDAPNNSEARCPGLKNVSCIENLAVQEGQTEQARQVEAEQYHYRTGDA